MQKIMQRRRWMLPSVAIGALLLALALKLPTNTPAGNVSVARSPAPASSAIDVASTRPEPAHPAMAKSVDRTVPGVRQDYIVQAANVQLARRAVERAGGVLTGEIEIIRAVGASLDARELAALWEEPVDGLQVYDDAMVSSSGATVSTDTYYPTEVAANQLQQGGVMGAGVTVAVLDTGLWREKGPLQQSSYGREPRVLAQYDVILAREHPDAYNVPPLEKYDRDIDDLNGHGTHVASIIASSANTASGTYQGVAPGVNLVSVRVLDAEGAGRYFDVIRGIQWVVANRATYGIRVLNLSLSAEPRSHYWEDPLNQAVMNAWAAGIVVVTAAGNAGPSPMTIGVPGNNPYVITVGAVTDNYQPYQPSEYRLASFSSAGPTYEGFIKPEVVAMGGHIRAYAPDNGTLAQRFPEWVDTQHQELTISGTSQAAAVTSGVVALMLDANPLLQPDDVKCRLMSSARPAVNPNGTLAYSVFQQGAGLVNARDAVYSTASKCANQGLNVALDLAGMQHYGGRANQDANGNFYVMEVQKGPISTLLGGLASLLHPIPLLEQLVVGLASTLDGLLWDGSAPTSDGQTWSDDYTWGGGYTWSNGYTWSDSYTWGSGYTWSNIRSRSVVDPGQQE